jgi:hypothetical protein
MTVLALLLFSLFISPELQEKLNTTPEHHYLTVCILPKGSAPFHLLGQLFKNKRDIADYLRNVAEESQRGILEDLKRSPKKDVLFFQGYWVNGMIRAKLRKSKLLELLERPDIEYVELEARPLLMEKGIEGSSRSLEWNIERVQVEPIWRLGFMGQGVIVGHMDTGFDPDHPALQGKWTGYWYDIDGVPYPYDNTGHGTHTLGTILGGDGPGPSEKDVGVAPLASFVSARAFTFGNPDVIPVFQWFASLVADSGVPIRVINNSWGVCEPHSTYYWNAVLTWRALGIIPVFAIGNAPNCGLPEPPPEGYTIVPGNYPTVIGVGATHINDEIAIFSLRGPAPYEYPWSDTTLWCNPDWNYIKPDISAPGVYVLSSVPGGGYDYYDGTSMATPHVTGAVAILLSIDSTLDYCDVYNLLIENTYQPEEGEPYPNNSYGWGILNVKKAAFSLLKRQYCFLKSINYEFLDDGDGDGRPDPGEEVEFFLTILDSLGWRDADSLTVTIRTDDSTLLLTDSIWVVGSLPAGDTIRNSEHPFAFQVLYPADPHLSRIFIVYSSSPRALIKADTFQFIVGQPPLLVVDEDGGDTLETYYFTTLDSLNALYDHWDINEKGIPSLHGPRGLLSYKTILWFTGSNSNCLTQEEIDTLTLALENGVNLLLSSQYVGEVLGDDPFVSNYLKAQILSNMVFGGYVDGVEGDPFTSGLSFNLFGHGGANNATSCDEISPQEDAHLALIYRTSESGAGLWYEGTYRLFYLAFPIESINEYATGYSSREDLLCPLLNWFGVIGVREKTSPLLLQKMGVFPSIARDYIEITFSVRKSSRIRVSLYRADGRKVGEIDLGILDPGERRVRLDIGDLPRGVYFIRSEPTGNVARFFHL